MQKAEGENAMCLPHERNIKRFPNSCNSNVECYIESKRTNFTAKRTWKNLHGETCCQIRKPDISPVHFRSDDSARCKCLHLQEFLASRAGRRPYAGLEFFSDV